MPQGLEVQVLSRALIIINKNFMSIVHLEKIGLSGNVTEKMIEDEIIKNPSILGLGDLVLIERQRIQYHKDY